MIGSDNTAPWPAFLAVWLDSIRSVMEQISGIQFPPADALVAQTPVSLAVSPADFCFSIGFENSLAGQVSLQVEKSSALLMAGMLMGKRIDAPAGEMTADHHDAIAELIRIFCGTVSINLKSLQGEEIPVRLLDIARPAWKPASSGLLDLSAKSGTHLTVRIIADEMLSKTVQEAAIFRRTASAKGVVAQKQPTKEASVQRATQNALPSLGALRDLRLNARLSFGNQTMPLSDVMGCVPGSVIENNRQTEMPVELWVEGVLAGRGDIVTVDGSYGVCIRELCHPQSQRSYLQMGTVLRD